MSAGRQFPDLFYQTRFNPFRQLIQTSSREYIPSPIAHYRENRYSRNVKVPTVADNAHARLTKNRPN